MTDHQRSRHRHIHPVIGTSTAVFIVAPDPTGRHPDIYIAEIVDEDAEGRIAPAEQHEANGYLLAKAPALLKALEDAFTLLDRSVTSCITKMAYLSLHLNPAISRSSTAMRSPNLPGSKR